MEMQPRVPQAGRDHAAMGNSKDFQIIQDQLETLRLRQPFGH